MSMHLHLHPGRLAMVCLCTAALAACGGGNGSTASTSPTTGAPAVSTTVEPPTTLPTTASSAASTTTSVPAPAVAAIVPDHLRYDSSGLVQVRNGVEERLADGPVVWAADDRAGGVLYATGTAWGDAYQVWWRPVGQAEPVAVGFHGLPALVDGRPALLGRSEAARSACPDAELTAFVVHDLATGAETGFACLSELGDTTWNLTSQGGGRVVAFVGDLSDFPSASALVVLDAAGREVALPGNPYDGDRCGSAQPYCAVAGLLSPDGARLATWYRPDLIVVVPPTEETPEEGPEGYAAWLARLDTVPADVQVHDLDAGTERYRTVVPARTRLADFDGRFLVLAPRRLDGAGLWQDLSGRAWTIVDTTGAQPPVAVSGPLALLRPPSSTGGAAVAPAYPVVRAGDTGPWVTYLQQRLVARGASLAVDGRFGPGTAAGVRAVQQAAGVAVDGIAGPDTWSVLHA